MTSDIKTFQDLNFVQDPNYPHEAFNQPPKFNAELSTGEYTVSVVYGGNTYSSADCSPDGSKATYEVAVWDKYGEPLKLSDHDTVLGWTSPDEITRIMKLVQLRPDLLRPKNMFAMVMETFMRSCQTIV